MQRHAEGLGAVDVAVGDGVGDDGIGEEGLLRRVVGVGGGAGGPRGADDVGQHGHLLRHVLGHLLVVVQLFMVWAGAGQREEA